MFLRAVEMKASTEIKIFLVLLQKNNDVGCYMNKLFGLKKSTAIHRIIFIFLLLKIFSDDMY